MNIREITRCTFCMLALALAPQIVLSKQDGECPPPEQPTLSNALSQMIKERHGDDAMQCIIEISENESVQENDYSDEVRYQLAKQASDALESLSGEDIAPYQLTAAKLWESYLTKVAEPLDRTRLPFGITKIMQHARSGLFQDYLPVIAKSMSKARDWITTAQVDQLFATLKRCPNWTVVTRANVMSCASPCGVIGRTFLTELYDGFGAAPWTGSDGVKRLAVNAKAVEGALTCAH